MKVKNLQSMKGTDRTVCYIIMICMVSLRTVYDATGRQVSRLRNDFFRLKPTDDGHRTGGENLMEKMDLSNMFYDSSQGGAKTFRLSFDVSQFRPEEISITTNDQRLVVHAKHEGKSTPYTRILGHV